MGTNPSGLRFPSGNMRPGFSDLIQVENTETQCSVCGYEGGSCSLAVGPRICAPPLTSYLTWQIT